MPKLDESQAKPKRKTGLGTSAFFKTVPPITTNPQTNQQISKPASQYASIPVSKQNSKLADQQNSKTASQQASKPANQQANKPANQQANKPANQQTSKPVNQRTSKPASQQASMPVSQQASIVAALATYATDEKTKATYYLTDSTLDRLEEITNATKKHAGNTYGRAKRNAISKSFLVEAALQIILDDFYGNKTKSLLTKKLAAYLDNT